MIPVFIDDWGADGTSEPSRSGDQRAGGNLGKADGGKTGCDGTTENAGSDEMGWIDEEYKGMCGRNCAEREYIYVSKKGSRKAALWQSKNRVLG